MQRELARPFPKVDGGRAEGSGAAGSLRRLLRRFRKFTLGLACLLVLLGAWEWAVQSGRLNALLFSSPLMIGATLGELLTTAAFWNHVAASVSAFLFGCLLAIAIGVPLGIAMGWYPIIADLLDLTLFTFYSIPRVAFVPVLILILGLGTLYKAGVVFLLAFFPILLNTISGIKTVDASLVRMARAMGASDLQVFSTVAIPHSIPVILTGIRQGLTLGLVGVVVAELFAAQEGLGFLIVRASRTYDSDTLYAAVAVLAIAGIVLNSTLQRIEDYFSRWRGTAPLGRAAR